MSGATRRRRGPTWVSRARDALAWHEQWLRPTRILGLVAGRAIFRLTTYGAGIALIAIWGRTGFASFAAPMGATGWILTAVGGTEKAAQTFLPKDPRRALERFFVLAAVVPYAMLVLAWAVASVVAPASELTTYAAAAALACGVGGTSATVALFRMRGRPVLDAVTYLHLSLGYIVGVVAVVRLDLDVRQLFMLLLIWQTSAVAMLVWRFRGQRIGAGSVSSQRWEAVRAIPLLSAGDLASAVGASILYVELTWGPDRRVLSTFYVAALLLTAAAMLWTYLLRLVQPGVVRLLAEGQGGRAVGLGRRVVARTAATGLIGTAGLGAAAWWAGTDRLFLVAALVVLEPLLFIGASFGSFVLENIDPRARRRAAAAAIPELFTVVAVGAALAPSRGATGALIAICAGQTMKSAVLFAVLSSVNRSRGVLGARPAVHASTARGAAR